MIINFFFPEKKIILKERKKLKLFIKQIFGKEKSEFDSLNYIFCSDEELLRLNKQFLKHDYYTDILTFDFSSSSDIKFGEIYISYDRVAENAQNLNINFKTELHRVIFHGALHLCGYSDKSKIDITKMRSAEDKYLSLYFSNVPRETLN